MRVANLLNTNIITLTVTHFLWGFVNSVYLIQIQPLLLSIYGTTPESAQILGAILTIGSFSAVIPLLLGFFADLYGRKRLIIIGETISLLGLIGLSIGNSVVWLSIFSIIVFNLGIGFYDSPLQGLIHESALEKRGLAYSIVYNSSSIAGIIASFMIQNEMINGEYFIYFQISCLLFALAIMINFIILRDTVQNKDKISFPLVQIFKKPLSRLTAIAFFLDTFSWGLPLSIANGIYIILFGVDVAFIATLTLTLSIVLVLFQYPAGFLVDRFGRLFGLIMGEVTGIIWIILTLISITLLQAELLILAYAILGVSVAFWRPSVVLSFIEVDPAAVSTNFGILSFVQRLGGVPTAAVAGTLFPLIGFSPLLAVTFIGTLIVIVMFFKIDRLEKNQLAKTIDIQ
ncbi:MAG: MFS transporter [Candidatus Heimdallarchaeota archaeon]|nr:MAG: MFS transporter [Candidatus Heimdallarchaeota archaeon]